MDLKKIFRLNLDKPDSNGYFFQSIQSSDFKGLSNIHELTLTFYHYLGLIPEDLFVHIPSLSRLKINSANQLPEGIFKNLTSLKELFIMNLAANNGPVNPKDITLSEDLLADLSSLETIYLHYSGITRLPFNFFKNNKSIKYINLSYTYVSELDSQFFAGLKNLKVVNLSHNGIKSLPNSLFRDNEITSLSLINNNLQSVNDTLFEDLKHAKSLDFRGNDIDALPKAFYSNLKNLEYLRLDYNCLTETEVKKIVSSIDKDQSINITVTPQRRCKN